MNPIPHGVPILPTSPFLPDGQLRLIMLLATLALFVTYGALLLVGAAVTRRRERIENQRQMRGHPRRPKVARRKRGERWKVPQ